ncbi:integrase [Pelomonas saccharophila]|uniref:Integrase n=1 Tax=Roseateles saccharophilus TaxID=304 RepID=A0ABU1YMP7_ROSSA|nr:tyrosine-type recombinase/integrase [Roseateles saccharophilus]MDR7270124.1 integrase [Roseateles saccharophilus]
MTFSGSREHRLVHLRPQEIMPQLGEVLGDVARLAETAEARFRHLPLLSVPVDGAGMPVRAAALFLARCALESRGRTGDSQRTYAECLLDWLEHLWNSAEGVALPSDELLLSATEETLQLYRTKLFHAETRSRSRVSSATANLRVTVVAQFYLWAQVNGFESLVGEFLRGRSGDKRSLARRVVVRHPRQLGVEELIRLFGHVRSVFRLMFRWCLVTGMRRFEIHDLLKSMLPSPQSLPFDEDGLSKIQIRRKGGKEAPIYAPASLIEETNWYWIADRPKPMPGFEDVVFLNRQGRAVSRQSLSREFRRCANLIGSEATLHHLRHTFAVNVLKCLEKSRREGAELNSLKTLQVLLGHSNAETTEVYLQSLEVSSDAVVSALDYLYGNTQ